MDNQTALNAAAAGLMAQGCCSIGNVRCAYRGREGRKCGVGFLIPDELYGKELEGHDSYELLDLRRMHEHFRGCDPALLKSIQRAHDNAACIENVDASKWRDEMAVQMVAIADIFRLEIPPAVVAWRVERGE